jgi:hypothetical protein
MGISDDAFTKPMDDQLVALGKKYKVMFKKKCKS